MMPNIEPRDKFFYPFLKLMLDFFLFYLYVSGSGSITTVGEEKANLSAVVYL